VQTAVACGPLTIHLRANPSAELYVTVSFPQYKWTTQDSCRTGNLCYRNCALRNDYLSHVMLSALCCGSYIFCFNRETPNVRDSVNPECRLDTGLEFLESDLAAGNSYSLYVV